VANPNPSDQSPRRLLDPPAGASEAPPFEPFELELHGHRAVYRRAGNGPPVVLIHGMLNSSRHWEAVAARLSADYTVIAPDLLGHGDSATTQGDYSLGAHASGIRDVLSALGIDRATIVGHSLGGGVAMQFFYQFPERSERLVLISSGGLGREVSWPLRLTALPGAEALVALASSPVSLATLRWTAERLRIRGSGGAANVRAAARALGELEGAGARRAFLSTLRSVIGVRGQRVNAQDRLYLAGALPTLVMWGGRDHTIPVEHGHAAHAAVPGSRMAILEHAAHFPHLEDAAGVASTLSRFLASTAPARLDAGAWRELIDRDPQPGGRGERPGPAVRDDSENMSATEPPRVRASSPQASQGSSTASRSSR
jgi:pimeloyl-ACP methyl ester carboxylesterase